MSHNNIHSVLSEEQRVVIEEAAQVLESAAAHNRKNYRTILAHTQQDRANRLRSVLTATDAGQDELTKFDAWARSRGWDVQRYPEITSDLVYISSSTQSGWLVWKSLTATTASAPPSAIELLKSLLSYTKACEGMLNASPAGQVKNVEDFLADVASAQSSTAQESP